MPVYRRRLMTNENTVKAGEQISELKHGAVPVAVGHSSGPKKIFDNPYFRSKVWPHGGTNQQYFRRPVTIPGSPPLTARCS
jgi:hypothetical protein